AATTSQPAPPQWVIEKQIAPLDVPDNLDVKIRPLDNPFNTNAAQNTQPTASWLSGSEAPPVVWFGTGEATPVQISIQKTNADKQTFAVGNPIIVNQAGAIEVAK
ncbi:MAG TPA: prepilin-type cleavage/methylation domain-containing protein, partial [Moraxellaceae bacterium]|nr:prepilin-type cleavage/methylation domain-containing protein [Moraxellaceae bacterium]